MENKANIQLLILRQTVPQFFHIGIKPISKGYFLGITCPIIQRHADADIPGIFRSQQLNSDDGNMAHICHRRKRLWIRIGFCRHFQKFFTAACFPEINLRIYKRSQQVRCWKFLKSVFHKHRCREIFYLTGYKHAICNRVVCICLFHKIGIREFIRLFIHGIADIPLFSFTVLMVKANLTACASSISQCKRYVFPVADQLGVANVAVGRCLDDIEEHIVIRQQEQLIDQTVCFNPLTVYGVSLKAYF